MDVAVALVNRAVARGVGASRLPGLALREGVPQHLRTLVAMPVLLNSRAGVEEHLHRLEIHYLASPDEQLHFALLSDWMDAATERMPEDDALLDVAIVGIAGSTGVMALRPAANDSCCCTAAACGAKASSAGWDGSASAASWTNSIACCAAPPTPPISPAPAGPRGFPRACATCSRWTPIRACRARRRAGSSARWRIR